MKFLRCLMIGLLIASLFACSSNDDDNIPSARLRVVQVSPDASLLDVLLDGDLYLNSVNYLTATDYRSLESGSRFFTVNAANSFTTFLELNRTLIGGEDHTFIILDFASTLGALFLDDDNRPPASGRVLVRIVHAAASADLVDVYIVKPGEDIESLEPTLLDIPFAGVSNYLSNSEGSYRVVVTLPAEKGIIAQSSVISMNEGDIYTVLVVDAVGGGEPFGFLTLKDRD